MGLSKSNMRISEEEVKGSKASWYGVNRTCNLPNCKKSLSIYNPNNYCYCHILKGIKFEDNLDKEIQFLNLKIKRKPLKKYIDKRNKLVTILHLVQKSIVSRTSRYSESFASESQ